MPEKRAEKRKIVFAVKSENKVEKIASYHAGFFCCEPALFVLSCLVRWFQ